MILPLFGLLTKSDSKYKTCFLKGKIKEAHSFQSPLEKESFAFTDQIWTVLIAKDFCRTRGNNSKVK